MLGHNQQPGQQPSSIPPPPPPPQTANPQDLTLAGVLHFLQTEWRRYERDRNEWEIERAEMRARIALLEGERRSFENVKLDLMRRIKMLEYALRVERSKQLTQPAPPAPSTKGTAAPQANPNSSTKEDSQQVAAQKEGSGASSPRSDDSPLPADPRLSMASLPSLPNGVVVPNGTKAQTWAGNWPTGPNGVAPAAAASAAAGLGKPPLGRDPKSRARSRDYLKQCLQEITYLTSPQAMNPLPNRPLINSNAAQPSVPLSLPNLPSFGSDAFNGRPRKVMPTELGKDFPMLNGIAPPAPSSSTAPTTIGASERDKLTAAFAAGAPIESRSDPGISILPPTTTSKETPEDEPVQVTAIYRPDDAGEWKERLRIANELSARSGKTAQPSALASWDGRLRDTDEEAGKEAEDEADDDETESNATEGEGGKMWRARRTLRNHLDAVRALAFHPSEMCLATGGDDCTVKIWRMDVASLASATTRPTTEIEPQLTLRGHTAPITRLVHSPTKGLLYSASLDATIRIWALPGAAHTTYAPYDASRARGTLVGHTDAIWDLALVRDESVLVSCGAEGVVKVWDVGTAGAPGSLRLSWGYNGVSDDPSAAEIGGENAIGATAVEGIKTDLKKLAVAYRDAVVKLFDLETGKEVMKFPSDISYDGTPASQINKIVSHPTMPLLVTAHEDKYIRLFDIVTGQCTHSMLAHLDAVTSLSIDASGFSLVSGGHDCSVRFWDLLNSRACVQEISSHRKKADEGVLEVEFHPTLPFLASAGADGVVKLYASS